MASNINSEYEELIASLADRAKLNHEDEPELSRGDCVNQAINDGYIYGSDQAYVVAHALINGILEYGKEITIDDWCRLEEDLFCDILDELRETVPDSDWE